MQISYTIRFAQPSTHYLQAEMQIRGIDTAELKLKMPVWTPGSYLIREFARHIDFVEAEFSDGHKERVKKINKNTWLLKTAGQNAVTVRYNLYCFEWSVRTNFVDEDHAFLNGAPTYLYVEGQEHMPVEIHFEPHSNWKRISTVLQQKENDPWTRVAYSLDELIDSPVEIGNHASYFFEAGGVPHEVAIFGDSEADVPKLLNDLRAIAEEETKLFGSNPCPGYLFIIHHSENSFGGLEHENCSVNHITRKHYDEKKYKQAISLLSHEYFHLWNVKRIRPAELVNYNYEQETYTELLWFFEGVTSYYDDLLCYRSGIFSQAQYIEIVADNLNRVLNTPGIHTQSLAEASFDTWIKYYRQNENSVNSQISYYTKGGIISMLFDFMIMDATNGERSLDDVLRKLYADYLKGNYKGISEQSLLQALAEISGIDFHPYFQKYIHNTDTIQPEIYFELLGLKLSEKIEPGKIYLGLTTSWKEKLIVTKLEKGFGAYAAGLNIQDHIISIDGIEVTEEFEKIYANKKAGDSVQVILSRQGIIKEIPMLLTADTRKHFQIEFQEHPTAKQNRLLKKWLPSVNANAEKVSG